MSTVRKMKLVIEKLGYVKRLRCGDIVLYRPGYEAPVRTIPVALWIDGDRKGLILATDFSGGTHTISCEGLSLPESFTRLRDLLSKLADTTGVSQSL